MSEKETQAPTEDLPPERLRLSEQSVKKRAVANHVVKKIPPSPERNGSKKKAQEPVNLGQKSEETHIENKERKGRRGNGEEKGDLFLFLTAGRQENTGRQRLTTHPMREWP